MSAFRLLPPTRSPAWLALITLGAVLWIASYSHLVEFADRIIGLLGFDRSTRLGEALHFFFYDTPKVLLLLTGVVFVMGIVHTFFTPERTRALLAGRAASVNYLLAALLGAVTPFCSCSAVPLFIGFLSAGVPLGITLTFLVAAPMIDQIAVVMLFAMFGWKVAALYFGFGIALAVSAGMILARMDLEHLLEDWVVAIQQNGALDIEMATPTWPERFASAWASVKEIVGRVWPYVMVGIAIGAGIHGYVPQELMATLMGKDAWWAVPAAVGIGVPMYTNTAGVIPIVEALYGKGAAMGTLLAFMMSVVALSLPEMIILRKALKLKLIAIYVAIVASGIVIVGYLFNFIL
jgi:uncharacterized membrane protein YraQ (UPF0718 family)